MKLSAIKGDNSQCLWHPKLIPRRNQLLVCCCNQDIGDLVLRCVKGM